MSNHKQNPQPLFTIGDTITFATKELDCPSGTGTSQLVCTSKVIGVVIETDDGKTEIVS